MPSFLAPYMGEAQKPSDSKLSTMAPVTVEQAIKPENYKLSLKVDPRKETMDGVVKIQIQVENPTEKIRLDAEDLVIQGARIESQQKLMVGRWSWISPEQIEIHFPSMIQSGRALLEVQFQANQAKHEKGIFRVQHATKWYAFSQFSPNYARRGFPCFSRSDLKAPFEIQLTVPDHMTALSNTPEVNRTRDGESLVIDFARTMPLSPQLVAIAVGSFEFHESNQRSKSGPPIRIVTLDKSGTLASHALKTAPDLLSRLAAYLQMPIPVPKFDIVAIPRFRGGASHGSSLMHMRETLVLVDNKNGANQRRRWIERVFARQMAQTWFGTLVGAKDRSNAWLNEAISTHLAQRIIQNSNATTDIHAEVHRLRGLWAVMALDAHTHAKAIDETMIEGESTTESETGTVFIKGAAIFHMIEAWIGPDIFRRALNRYLKLNAGGTAGLKQWNQALDKEASRPVSSVLNSFVTQTGAPHIDMKLDCSAGVATKLHVAQMRALPPGSLAAREQRWRVPICVRYGDDQVAHDECFLLESRESVFTLPTSRCPTWFHGNRGETGYYQWSAEQTSISALLERGLGHLSAAERIGLPRWLQTAQESGRLSLDEYIASIEFLLDRSDPLLISGVLKALETMDRWVSEPQERQAFARWIRRILNPVYQAVGQQGDPMNGERSLRGALGHLGQDPTLILEATELANRFLKNPDSIPHRSPMEFLPMAACNGDESFWLALKKTLDGKLSPMNRVAVVSALGTFGDPVLFKKSLDLIIDGPLSGEDFAILGRGIGPRTRQVAWAWLTDHYHALSKSMAVEERKRLPWLGLGYCTESDLEKVIQFFEEPQRAPPGTAHHLDLVSERIQKCINQKKLIESEWTAWINGLN